MLKDEIIPYTDPSCGIVNPNTTFGCQNNMFTSEYIIMLIRNGEATPNDINDYFQVIRRCCVTPGLLARTPYDKTDQESVDDYLGLVAALSEIGTLTASAWASMFLFWGKRHYGDFNNQNPNKFTWDAWLVRQLQLVACYRWVAGRSWNPFLSLYAALSIFVSCRNVPPGETNSWRLGWLLVQVGKKYSRLCRLAAKGWYKRLYRTYPGGMKDVAKIYYAPGHPFAKYWID